jgi:hypothetical protein
MTELYFIALFTCPRWLCEWAAHGATILKELLLKCQGNGGRQEQSYGLPISFLSFLASLCCYHVYH